MSGHEPHQGLAQDFPSSYSQLFQPQSSSRPSSQPHQQILPTPQRIQQPHQTLNLTSLSNQSTPSYQLTHSSSTHPQSQQFLPLQMAAVTPNQSNFQPHPTQHPHSLPSYNSSHVYTKSNPTASHQVMSTPLPPAMARPSQQQMAQHLMNPQSHMRSQRLLQQQQQQIAHHQREEQMMTCDPLDCYTTRNLALRRYTTNHVNMNTVLGTHWTVNQLLRQDHIHLISKRKDTDSPASNSIQQRKERLRKKINEVERDIQTAEINYQAQLSRIQSA